MPQGSYLSWLTKNTKTSWWHDSADPRELDLALERGCVGVTTNPFLSHVALAANRRLWASRIQTAIANAASPEEKAEALMRIPVTEAAAKLLETFQTTEGAQGYVCAQVNPSRAGDRDRMLAMARRFRAWAPNISVKLPATAAGLDVLEDCVAEGITATATVSFTVPQVLAIAERHRQGVARAKASGIAPGRCFAVLMVGRLDDYLRELADDAKAEVKPADLQQAGLAVTKRALAIYRQRGYEAVLLPAAMRGTYHLTELAGAELVMSIFPAYQEPLMREPLPREERIDRPIAPDVLERLGRLPDFVRAYEPEGMKVEEFMAYGLTQRTLGTFIEAGWKPMEAFQA